MKYATLILFTMFTMYSFAQDKNNYIHYNKLTPVEGSHYVMATFEDWGKKSTSSDYLLFINAATGQSKQIQFPKDSYFERIEQIKIDSLGINKIMMIAKTVNLDNNKTIDWNDPRQIIILSTDGQEKTQLTEDKYFVSTWLVNRQTGTIIVAGYYDSNNNGKYDKTDINQISIYDLKTLTLINKI